MPIVFNADERKAISRRIVKIPIENDAYDLSINGLDEAQTAFIKVDEGNTLWFNWYNDNISEKYSAEKRAMDGYVYSTVIEQNLQDSASLTAYNLFFEKTTTYNKWLIPKITYMVNAQMATPFRTDGTAGGTFQVWEVNNLLANQIITVDDSDSSQTTGYIQNIAGTNPYTITVYDITTGAPLNLSAYTTAQAAYIKEVRSPYYESDVMVSIVEIYDILKTGFTGGISSVGTYDYSAKTVTVVTNTWGIGQKIIGDAGVDGAVLEITGAPSGLGPYVYTVREIVSTGIDLTAVFESTFGGFSNTERQNLTGSSYDNALNALATKMKNLVYNNSDSWQDYLQIQESSLTLNEEDRTAKQTQNLAALADVTNALLVITTWIAKPNTGATGKFADAQIDTINTEIVARQAFIPGRIVQIDASLGGVVDNNDGTFTYTTSDKDILYRRYQFIDYRINKAYGSLSKAIRQTNASDIVQTLKDVNTGLESEYITKMTATRFSANANNSTIINVEDSTGFTINDNVYVITETQAEIAALIVGVRDNEINLNVIIPDTYSRLDLARLYKVI